MTSVFVRYCCKDRCAPMPKHHIKKLYMERGGKYQCILDFGRRQSVQFHAPAAVPSWEIDSGNYWIDGRVSPKAGLNVLLLYN